MARLVISVSEERNVWHPRIEIADRICFPDDDPIPLAGSYWWVETDEDKAARVLSYAALRPLGSGVAFLERAGVLPCARGRGSQRRLISARTRYARRLGVRVVVTYTSPTNIGSAVNLVREGYEPFVPEYQWAGAYGTEANYWRRTL
jgi:GNAT superfamily N-acetyltransferase